MNDTQTAPVFVALKDAPKPPAKICPLLMIAHPTGPSGARQCLENQCAWWENVMGACEVKTMSIVLAGLAAHHDVKLMPTEAQNHE